MSSDTINIINRNRSNMKVSDFLSELTDNQKQSLTSLINSSTPNITRKTIYISAGGKFAKYEDFLRSFAYQKGYVPIHPISTLA